MDTIIKEIGQVQEVVGGAVNPSVNFKAIKPYMIDVIRDYITPVLGRKLVTRLIEDQDNQDENIQLLLYYTRKTASFLTLWKYVPIGSIQLSEMGLLRSETENMKSAYKYQEQSYRDGMRDAGHEAKEELITFLQENESDYEDFTTELLYATRSRILFSAEQFRKAYATYISRYSYEILQPIIDDLEAFAIQPILGDDFFYEIKEKVQKDDLDEREKELVRRIRKVVANFTVEEGMRRLWVKIEGKNIVEVERLEPQGMERQGSAKNISMSVSLRHSDIFGNRHVSYLKKYIKDNADHFSIEVEWLAESFAQDATTQNDFEVLSCGCINFCDCNLGVINL